MYSLRNLLDKSPIQISSAILAVVNLSVVMNWLVITADQISALNMALVAILGLFIVSKTANKATLQEFAEDVEASEEEV